MADLQIIDDDLDSADVLSAAMTLQGHDVRTGYNGQEGMHLVKERLPDLVLLDVEMPIMSGPGMALAMLIYDMGSENVPVILLSGVPDLVEVARQVGTPYFLSKPYRLAAITAMVNRAVHERFAPRHEATTGS
jgi:DNA-binding NtrC family response regulator